MSKYIIKAGDTFERIAKKLLGNESKADIIRKANPGASLTPGTTLTVEDILTSDFSGFRSEASKEDEVSVQLEGTRFRFWDSVSIQRSIDSFDTLELTAPFEVDNVSFRQTFKPFSYKKAIVSVGGEPLFSGVGVGVLPELSADRNAVSFNGYSLPGVLNDCSFPASSQLEFNDQNIIQIARSALSPFSLKVQIEGSPGPIFERVSAEQETKIFDFLTKLAKQRNLIIASAPAGALLFRRSVSPGKPVAELDGDSVPVISVTPEFKPQEYYSHVTGIQPTTIGSDGAQYTVTNKRLQGVVRPLTFKVDDAADGSLKAAVEAKVGRMFGNCASYSVELSTWRDDSNELWRPNTTLTLIAPRAMIYRKYEFIIKNVTFTRTDTTKTALLTLVLPGAYSGQIPEALPWDA